MEDKQIIDLFWARAENAIAETAEKYGRYCYSIAYHILHNGEDSEECVNDTYLKAWEAMPPAYPGRLSAFLGKITRNLALHRYERCMAKKRGAGEMTLLYDELAECIPAPAGTERTAEDILLADIFNRFLAGLRPEARRFFMRRYWYFASVKEIASEYDVSESKVKMSLLRSRNELRKLLEKEGIDL